MTSDPFSYFILLLFLYNFFHILLCLLCIRSPNTIWMILRSFQVFAAWICCLFYGNNLRKLYISYSMFFSIYSILLEFYNYSQLQLFLTATNFVHFTCIQHSLLHNQKAYRHVKSTGVQSISLSKIIATGR